MKKQIIRLTEGDLHKIIREAVKRAVKEMKGEKHKESEQDIDDYAEERLDLMANYDDFPPMKK